MSLCASLLSMTLVFGASADAATFSDWMKKARRAEARQDHAKTVEYYDEALRIWRLSHGKATKLRALEGKSAAYEALGRWSSAIRDLSEAIALSEQNTNLLLRRGKAYAAAEKHAKAITDLTKVILIEPQSGEAFLERGNAYEALGKASMANHDYDRACELGLEDACPRTAAAAPEEPGAEGAADEEAGPLPGACFGFLDRCIHDGGSFLGCVNKLETCEKNPVHGCCPEACRTRYLYLYQKDQSEAQAFREVFRATHPCLKK